MGDLRDQLNKAGFIKKKDMKRLAHEDRVRHKAEGSGAREKDLAKSSEEFARQKQEKKARDQEIEATRQGRKKDKESLDRLKALVESQRIKDLGRGRKFFFETRKGFVPFLEAGMEITRQLEGGSYAIVELPWGNLETFVILPRKAALEVHKKDPAAIRLLVGI